MILEKAFKTLKRFSLCDNCLGRLFALLLHGLDNQTRGWAVKLALALEVHRMVLEGELTAVEAGKLASNMGLKALHEALKPVRYKFKPNPCYVCSGVFLKIEELERLILNGLKDYEFESILVGVRVPAEVSRREEEVRSVASLPYGESLREELSRVLGKIVSSRLGVKVDFERPEVTVIIDPYGMNVEVNPAPVYVKGRFLKLSREIPVVSKARERAGGETVESLIAKPLMKALKADGYRFMVSFRDSRETIILGDGRPFLVKFKKPRVRRISLAHLAFKINENSAGLVRVIGLGWGSRKDVKELKTSRELEEAKVLVKPGASPTLKNGLGKFTVKQLDAVSGVFREEEVELLGFKPVGGGVYEVKLRYRVGFMVKDFLSRGVRVKPTLGELLGFKVKLLKMVEVKVVSAS